MPVDRLLFEDVSGTLDACREAVANSPDGADLAKLLARAEERMAAQKALMSDGKMLGEAYLRLYPQGIYAHDVRTHVASLGGAVVEPTHVPPVALPDGVDVPPEIANLSDRDVIAGVQTELNRLGCEAGGADGTWGNKGRQALASLELNLGQTVVSSTPSKHLLAQLRGVETRICPPCFTFNGKQYCE